MSEADRNPAIRIHIDQQVFIDAVLGNEEIEDATVVTEVVGFDRNESNYLLDGALVFSGYIRQEEVRELEITAEDLQGDIGSTMQEEEMTVQQIHCRMPFTLEVPVVAQRNEFINVVPRVGTWNLSALGPKWVHVRAELIVNGLTGEEGYRFRCGTQEEGIPESQAFAFAEGYRSTTEFNPQTQDSMGVDVAQTFDTQQSSLFSSQLPQFPFSHPWQKGAEGTDHALDGAYPFSAPFTSPFVRPTQPPSWDRQWPESTGSRSTANETEPMRSDNDVFESSVKATRGIDSIDQNEVEAGVKAVDDVEESVPIADESVDTMIQLEPTFESAFRVSQDDLELEEEVRTVANQFARHEPMDGNSTLDVETVTVDMDTDSVSFNPQLNDDTETQADKTFHFEEVAESSTLVHEPKFQLKIQGMASKESSTFGAMSTLMEAAQADRESVSGATEAIRESSSFGSAIKSATNVVDVTEQHSNAKPVEKLEVEVLESPTIVENVLEVTQPVQTLVNQERPQEMFSDTLTEVDDKSLEDAAAVTIAERKQLESESSRVYLWTELYPFLEETFQPIKFRIVQEDDSMDRIAESYRITTTDLMRANHMQTEQIDVGQLLYIPTRKR